ncbi:hypothetical protein FH063_002388 [Azospirillum argentinense]|uniref:Uncharacterized protein n=1 Tax=Azospirillum argentinense TaxID=2970906 RepID=A0A5B0KPJ1_9PROT|nr:hypothetical protein FH063_002388 [Azospirillum argentinense]
MAVSLSPALAECPFCGCREFAIRLQVSGVIREIYRFDGQVADNSGMWDSAQTRQQDKHAYCRDCERPIGQVVGQ